VEISAIRRSDFEFITVLGKKARDGERPRLQNHDRRDPGPVLRPFALEPSAARLDLGDGFRSQPRSDIPVLLFSGTQTIREFMEGRVLQDRAISVTLPNLAPDL
jgi:hypothetical protein